MKEVKEDLSKWRDIPCSWIESLNIAKLSIVSNLISTFKKIPMKITIIYFADTDRLILKFMYKVTRFGIANIILEKKYKDEGFILSIFRTYYKNTVLKIAWN